MMWPIFMKSNKRNKSKQSFKFTCSIDMTSWVKKNWDLNENLKKIYGINNTYPNFIFSLLPFH